MIQQPHYKLRKLNLSDDQGNNIEVKLWGDHATMEMPEPNTNICLRAVEVDTSGYSKSRATLNSTKQTKIEVRVFYKLTELKIGILPISWVVIFY